MEITKVTLDVLKIHPRNQEFFDDIDGEDYEQFKNSIQEDGIISEIIVAPDMTILSGHQRFKAAQELGIQMVPIRIREDADTEEKKLKLLLAANFGRQINSKEKNRKVITEYVSLCGYKPNGDRATECQNGIRLTLEEIAAQLGVSKRSLQRSLKIERNLTEDMKELLDSGVISETFAADVIAGMSEEEQMEFISGLDVTKKYTANELKKYLAENDNPSQREKFERNRAERLQEENTQLKKDLETAKSSTVEIKEVIPDDYEELKRQSEDYEKLKRKNKEYKNDYAILEKDFKKNTEELQQIRKQLKAIDESSPENEFKKKLKDSTITFCSRVADFIEKVGGYVWLTDHINELPNLERQGYIKAVNALKSWADTTYYNINNNIKEIN